MLKKKFCVKKRTPFRAWFLFRQGWSLYFAFVLAAVNTLTVTYFLAVERYPTLVDLFPTFGHYVFVWVVVGVPLLTFIGFVHYKRSPAYTAEVGLTWTSNPYQARNLINGELSLKLNLALLKITVKSFQNEKFEPEEFEEILRVKKEIEKLSDERTFWNKKDFDTIHRIEDGISKIEGMRKNDSSSN